jgi:hypothetical protein
MDISWTTVIIVILLIVVGYFIWSIVSSSSKTSSGTTKLATSTPLAVATSANSFTFSTWIAIDTWGGGGNNIVKTTGDTPDFSLSLGTTKNDLILKIGTTEKPGTNTTISNIVPLQTWASIIVSVNNGNSADIYVNGKLVRTVALTNVYGLSGGSVTVGGSTSGSTGYISTTFDKNSIGPQDAWNIYSSGFGGGNGVSDFFNKYKIRFAFVKDNVELSRLDI